MMLGAVSSPETVAVEAKKAGTLTRKVGLVAEDSDANTTPLVVRVSEIDSGETNW